MSIDDLAHRPDPNPNAGRGQASPEGFRHLGWYNYPAGGLLEGVAATKSYQSDCLSLRVSLRLFGTCAVCLPLAAAFVGPLLILSNPGNGRLMNGVGFNVFALDAKSPLLDKAAKVGGIETLESFFEALLGGDVAD